MLGSGRSSLRRQSVGQGNGFDDGGFAGPVLAYEDCSRTEIESVIEDGGHGGQSSRPCPSVKCIGGVFGQASDGETFEGHALSVPATGPVDDPSYDYAGGARWSINNEGSFRDLDPCEADSYLVDHRRITFPGARTIVVITRRNSRLRKAVRQGIHQPADVSAQDLRMICDSDGSSIPIGVWNAMGIPRARDQWVLSVTCTCTWGCVLFPEFPHWPIS